MPRNITSMEVSALKGQENMAVCGAEALEALKALKAESLQPSQKATSSGSAATEPEPEPELAADESPDQTLQECFLEAETIFRQICNSGLATIDPALQELLGSVPLSQLEATCAAMYEAVTGLQCAAAWRPQLVVPTLCARVSLGFASAGYDAATALARYSAYEDHMARSMAVVMDLVPSMGPTLGSGSCQRCPCAHTAPKLGLPNPANPRTRSCRHPCPCTWARTVRRRLRTRR
jgi:hypothetical protein